jgi:hypothetical protein
MTATILSVLSLILAAFFKAVADTLSHHFDTSVFKWRDRRFWDPLVSQSAPYLKGTKYRLDAWHLANSGMIVCFCVAAVLHRPALAWYWELLAGGILFNLSFNLFYNKLLR